MGVFTTSSDTDRTLGSGTPEDPWRAKQGITFRMVLRILDENGIPRSLTGYTGRSQLRRLADDLGAPVATATIVNHGTERGRADLSIGATTMATIAPGDYVLDADFTADGDADDVFRGTPDTQHVRVFAGVTKI